jgi:hypothetical protein
MSYTNIEYFSKMIKNAKNLRQKELRLSLDQAVLVLSEITEILSTKNQASENKSVPDVIDFDAGGFR